ncbi:ABC transporter ATP-binding protein [Acetivibrio sp. MSJd-27]|uniref:ABC transporter ATP-binding protein n=1 Tax=Acetivibrio sp. MSJd-27 TaxID=2841523 RepID=UPI001C1023B0|nr:ABC transporter ATP-binding protein [Acetivibrio sp. MSJd-27]MBU5449308.1 ABC transporter ATP-binding protein [Acetivibrio sp. MSJd-27]
MIQVNHITKYFEQFKALDDLCLHVKKGSVYGLIGPNGAGKTTVINHITGVYRPNGGEVLVNGQNCYENTAVKQKLLYIPDDLYFFATFSIQQMAKFYAETYKDFNWERYETLKQVFGIHEKKLVSKLSKGMKKQVAFWLAISSMPDVLVLDEPVDGLDPVMRKKVWNLVVQDVSERQMTVLVSSHNLRELEDICDTVGILHRGHMLLEKELDDLKGDIHKFQVAFPQDGAVEQLEKELEVLHVSKMGSVSLLIIKGDRKKISDKIAEYNPLISDSVQLTLEEVFIYELGGIGYDIKDIFI